ncbi:MAG: cation:proton antiporter subunit C [Alphaproteobacteria bacterium]|jgi:multicomponent Na+:H+ antiporter subunit C|nr:cation:proton antiporter subunit C [Alphaproteobacteria bacterium]MDP6589762.1 cation:proton antiporter subunit C [Alphaproteobacteria bacterium]MDP6818401.1 cation:proton antiporter subunit C [Alphaproteobacteria bacterium]
MDILTHFNYWAAIALASIGLYAVVARHNLIKKLIGLSLFQTAVFLLFITIGKVTGGTAPILDSAYSLYSNPLPHVLILTAIVVSVSTLAVGLALAILIKREYGTVEEDEIQAEDSAAGPGPA